MHEMDSIQDHSLSRRFALLALLLVLLPVSTQAAGVTIEKASTRLQNSIYQLNANINYELSDAVLEALNNGIAVTMQLSIKIEQPRSYLWDELIAEKSQRYELKFHALSGQYLVKTNTGEQRSYLSLTTALRGLGQIRALPILDQALLQDPQDVMVRLKTELDTNALPAPLRPVAWLSSEWKLSSEWYSCPLRY